MEKNSVNVQLGTGQLRVIGRRSTVITGHSFAAYWLDDAYQQSEGKTWHHVRREIIFSTAFLESYLFEWAQSQLSSDLSTLLNKFPQGGRIPSLRDKWSVLIGNIFEIKGWVNAPITQDADFTYLVDLRDKLLHAQSSRLNVQGANSLQWPEPSVEDLQNIANGWALNVAMKLVKSLHESAGTELPKYVSRYVT